MKIQAGIIFSFIILGHLSVQAQTYKQPRLVKKGSTEQLIVDDKPFLVLGGELGNSTGILQAEEGKYVNGKWIIGRRMNGDQDHQGRQ